MDANKTKRQQLIFKKVNEEHNKVEDRQKKYSPTDEIKLKIAWNKNKNVDNEKSTQ